MNFSPKSVFTGKGSNGENITFFEWDFATWAGFAFVSNIFYLLVALLLSAVASPILLVFAIVYFDGRNKLLYLIGIIVSSYFLYDCSHGWLVLSGINVLFSESTINFLVGTNVAALILFSVFFVIGGTLNNFIEDLTPTIQGRWMVFIIFLSLIILPSVIVTMSNKSDNKGWIMTNLKSESEGAKKERLEQERLDEIGDFESKEARDKHFDELEKRWGTNN